MVDHDLEYMSQRKWIRRGYGEGRCAYCKETPTLFKTQLEYHDYVLLGLCPECVKEYL